MNQTEAVSPADTLEREVVARAYKKVANGLQAELTREERTALKRHEREREERTRWQHYNAIPQKHWRQMSGRQAKVLIEQADRYGIPFGGSTVNLPAVARAFHDFLADNKHKLARDDDDLMNGSGSPALEKYRQERATMARLDRLEREGQLLPRDSVRMSLIKIAAVLRGSGEALQRQFGQGAADILNEAIDDAKLEIDRFFANPDSEGDGDEAE